MGQSVNDRCVRELKAMGCDVNKEAGIIYVLFPGERMVRMYTRSDFALRCLKAAMSVGEA